MDPRLKAFLDRARVDQIAPVGVQDYFDAERLFRTHEPFLQDKQVARGLKNALASLLATDQQQWEDIASLADKMLVGEAARHTAIVDIPLDHTEAAVSASSPRRLPRRILELPRAYFAAGGAVLIGASIVFALLARQPAPPAPVEPARTEARAPSETTRQPEWVQVAIDAAPVEISLQPGSPNFQLLRGYWPLLLLSALLLIFGGCWIQLPARSRRKADDLAERVSDEAHATRRVLSRKAEDAGAARRLVYHVVRTPPMREDAVADAATILSRTYGDGATADIDADRTVNATIAAGGLFTLVSARRIATRSITILVDVEKQSHPWLQDVEWLLERWAAHGVRFERFNFKGDPNFLLTAREGLPLSLDRLSRRTEGEPLLIISRMLTTRGFRGSARWLTFGGCWPVRAWLDPSPLVPKEMPRAYLAEISKLRHRGFQRFPFSEPGLISLATYLAASGVGVKPAAGKALPPLADPEIAGAVEKWALFSALVPDPTWDQLQAIREAIPDLRLALPDNRYLQRLLDWARANNKDGMAESGDGLTLEIDGDRIEELILKYRCAEASLPTDQKFETLCRELILNQLGGAPPTDELMRQFWELKRAQHRLAIEPAEGLAAMRSLVGGPWHDEVIRALEAELARDKAVPTLPASIRDAAMLETPEGKGIVPWKALFKPGPGAVAYAVLYALFILFSPLQQSDGATPSNTAALTGTLAILEPSIAADRRVPTGDFVLVGRTRLGPADGPLLAGDVRCAFPRTAPGTQWLASETQDPAQSTQDLRTLDVDEMNEATNSAAEPPPPPPDVVNQVRLGADGRILWNGSPVTLPVMQQYLGITTNMSPQPRLSVTVDRAVPCESAIALAATVRRANVCNRGLCGVEWAGTLRARSEAPAN